MQRLWALGRPKEVDTVYYCRKGSLVETKRSSLQPEVDWNKNLGDVPEFTRRDGVVHYTPHSSNPNPFRGDSGVFYVCGLWRHGQFGVY